MKKHEISTLGKRDKGIHLHLARTRAALGCQEFEILCTHDLQQKSDGHLSSRYIQVQNLFRIRPQLHSRIVQRPRA